MTPRRRGLLLVLAIAISSSARAQAPAEPARMTEAPPRKRRRRPRAVGPLLRPGGRTARSQLLPRERPGLPADPDRHHRAGHRLRRRPRRHVPAAAQGSRQRRLGASRHLRRRRRSPRRTGPRAPSPPMPAGGSTDACARLVGAATGKVNLDFYGLGGDAASLDQKVRYSLNFSGGVAQANWQLAPKSPWAVGLRYVYADVDPKLREDSALAGLADRAARQGLGADRRPRVRHPRQPVHADPGRLRRDRRIWPRARLWARARTSSASSRS